MHIGNMELSDPTDPTDVREFIEDAVTTVSLDGVFREMDAHEADTADHRLEVNYSGGTGMVELNALSFGYDPESDDVVDALSWRTESLMNVLGREVFGQVEDSVTQSADTITTAFGKITDGNDPCLIVPSQAGGRIGTIPPYRCDLYLDRKQLLPQKALVVERDSFGFRVEGEPITVEQNEDLIEVSLQWGYLVTDPEAACWIEL